MSWHEGKRVGSAHDGCYVERTSIGGQNAERNERRSVYRLNAVQLFYHVRMYLSLSTQCHNQLNEQRFSFGWICLLCKYFLVSLYFQWLRINDRIVGFSILLNVACRAIILEHALYVRRYLEGSIFLLVYNKERFLLVYRYWLQVVVRTNINMVAAS